MQAQLAATFDAIFAWTAPLRLRKLAQIPCSLPSDIEIPKRDNISLSLALRWLAHYWSRYTMTVRMSISLRVSKIADGSLYWLADI
jgi:hypothetical protein